MYRPLINIGKVLYKNQHQFLFLFLFVFCLNMTHIMLSDYTKNLPVCDRMLGFNPALETPLIFLEKSSIFKLNSV